MCAPSPVSQPEPQYLLVGTPAMRCPLNLEGVDIRPAKAARSSTAVRSSGPQWARQNLLGSDSLRRLREFRQPLQRSIRAELRRSLIPFVRPGGMGLNPDSAEPLDEERIEGLSQGKRGTSAACLGRARANRLVCLDRAELVHACSIYASRRTKR
jgi:hypothetical protein